MASPDRVDVTPCAADYCPNFQHAVELIGRRWTGSILKSLNGRSLRFGEIRAAVPGLSDRLLDSRLSELEQEAVVARSESDGEVRYALTEKGEALGPVFEALASWSERYMVGADADAPGRRRC